MTTQSSTPARRLWAAAALVLALATAVLVVVLAVRGFPNGLSVLACALAAIGAAWFGVVRRGALRVIGLAVAALLLIAALLLVILEGQLLGNLLVLVGLAATLGTARLALRVHVAGPPAPRCEHPVLFYNPRSGGGKAARFHLASEARRRGIEAIELGPGEDLETLVRAAVERGADALAMAGGDGSQAIVAMVAAELELPYACIPAGTRNHFALDLGVDRDDVVGALDALVDGWERRVDLAEVNGRVFVNNVSLGLYAEAVARPGYREAKLHTILETVPDAIGPTATPPRFTWESGTRPQTAVAVLVSNDPYRLGRALASGTRPRLDRGVLGITAMAPSAAPNGSGGRRLRMRQWTRATFELRGDGRVPAGIDGEAVELDSPLRFETRPAALRVRIAPHHPGASPSAVVPETPWQAVGALARLAIRGTPTAGHGAR